MKSKDFQVLKAKTIVELKKLVDDRRKQAVESYTKIKAGQEKNVKKVKNLRRDIAQILTVIREKEILRQNAKSVEHKGNEN